MNGHYFWEGDLLVKMVGVSDPNGIKALVNSLKKQVLVSQISAIAEQ